MKVVNCEIDGSSDTDFVLQSPLSDGPLVRCRRCGLFYISPRLSDHTFHDFTAEDREARNKALTEDAAVRFPDASVDVDDVRTRTVQQRLERILSWRHTGRLLDIGCERGMFLSLAREHFDVSGLETDSNTAQRARALGLEVFNGTLREARFPDACFDVVTAFHVIEHMNSPSTELGEINRVLKPGGLLVIETPNIDNVWFRILRSRWRQFIHDHYLFLDHHTMDRLLRKTGFEPLEIASIGKPVNLHFLLARMARYWKGSLLIAERVRRLRLNRVYFNVNPGDILIAFARKPEA